MATKKQTSTRTAKAAKTRSTGATRGSVKKTAKKRSPQNIAIIALAAALVFMGIGFAAYSATLTIGSGLDNKDVIVKPATWGICWEDATISDTKTGTATGAVSRDSCTAVTFNATLNKPGDAYSFTVNAENTGTINAELNTITMTALTTDQAKYLEYTVSYDGTVYRATTSDLAVALNAGAKKPVIVTVRYKAVSETEQGDIPTTEQTVQLSAAFDYADANN